MQTNFNHIRPINTLITRRTFTTPFTNTKKHPCFLPIGLMLLIPSNFRFALVRSGTKMIRLKVNKVTSHTSHDEFNKLTIDIAHRL